MTTPGQAVIAIRRPEDWVGRSWRSFIVRIDGRRAGRVGLGAAGEFAVSPGAHTVEVSMDWVRSLPLQLTVEPGSRVELVIRGRPEKGAWWRGFLPIIIVFMIAEALAGITLEAAGLDRAGFWVRTGVFLAAAMLVYAGLVLATSLGSRDYWAAWKLEPINR